MNYYEIIITLKNYNKQRVLNKKYSLETEYFLTWNCQKIYWSKFEDNLSFYKRINDMKILILNLGTSRYYWPKMAKFLLKFFGLNFIWS